MGPISIHNLDDEVKKGLLFGLGLMNDGCAVDRGDLEQKVCNSGRHRLRCHVANSQP
jgi:hypothetical protein